MDGKITKFLSDLSGRIQEISSIFASNQGGELKSIIMNDVSFDKLNDAMKEADYWNMEDQAIPSGASGVLWGIPIFTDDNLSDGDLKFNIT